MIVVPSLIFNIIRTILMPGGVEFFVVLLAAVYLRTMQKLKG
jgi:hypothetical protein